MKKNDKFRNLPVSMVAFRNREVDTFQGMKQGADEYSTKPFKPEDLRETVNKILPVPGGGPFGLY